MTTAQEIEDIIRRHSRYPMGTVDASLPIGKRFDAIRSNYRSKARRVEDGLDTWSYGDPYEIADWVSIFSPIEYDAWCEIRGLGVPLWPQLPVGKYFVDFGNPVVKIALECDGKEWHDAERDAKRDADLLELGWSVYRVTGKQCAKTRFMLSPEQKRDYGEDVDSAYIQRYDSETVVGAIKKIKQRMEGRA
ncbi:endonuclease domain-containing protein [Cupriavidus gilardii]|uniref:endonuclease domain-containing protein n=1 Tax=Cupriavidus gilardii TaxID=82541 RepID=UPI001571C10E|nr:DUF559 domain-containing protein [Cupriavidus gilardii]NSX05066.1 DUF559 domain-containing protein [Cupriavidus gilardii]